MKAFRRINAARCPTHLNVTPPLLRLIATTIFTPRSSLQYPGATPYTQTTRSFASTSQAHGRYNVDTFANELNHDPGEDTTIFALSTAHGRSAIAVVRISGPACLDIYHSLCPNKPPPKPRHATLRVLYNPTNPHEPLDPGALILYFPAPHSTTGEDVLELHLHGGPAIIRSILLALPTIPTPRSRSRIEPAEPGAFTRRAFYNTRLSIPQIEALSDALTAETASQLHLAHSGGKLTLLYEKWRDRLVDARGELEALIDFSEDQQFEETPRVLVGNVVRVVKGLVGEVEKVVGDSRRGELLRSGISIAVVGPTNAGKSSLVNEIVGREAVIVSEEEGTTRDVVDVAVDLGGFMMVVGDTAGLRGEGLGGVKRSGQENRGNGTAVVGSIEREGINRAKQRVKDAQVAVVVLPLFLTGPTSPTSPPIDIHIPRTLPSIIASAVASGKELVIAVNKIDLLPHTSTPPASPSPTNLLPPHILAKITTSFPSLKPGRIACISCRTTGGASTGPSTINPLLTLLTSVFTEMTSPVSTPPATTHPAQSPSSSLLAATPRQRHLLQTCLAHLMRFLAIVEPQGAVDATSGGDEVGEGEGDVDVVIAAEELRGAAECLGRITGRGEGAGDVEEVLGVVFERFCVGK